MLIRLFADFFLSSQVLAAVYFIITTNYEKLHNYILGIFNPTSHPVFDHNLHRLLRDKCFTLKLCVKSKPQKQPFTGVLLELFWKILQESTCNGVTLIEWQVSYNFVKKEAPTQVFSCELGEIFQSIFFTEHTWANVSKTTRGTLEIYRNTTLDLTF